MKINAVYGQSGGPTCVINSTMYGVIKQCLKEEKIDKIYLMHNGIKGLIDNDLKCANEIDEGQLSLLPFTPGSIIGSVRYKLKDFQENEEDYLKILDTLKANNIHIIFYNGGNDSMDTCNKLSIYLKAKNYECKVIGLPKTIDNDLLYTDHTPGYGTACKFIASTIQSFYYDNSIYPSGRAIIVEMMGRDTGWLTASSALASVNGHGPDLIYLPEVPFKKENFLNDVKRIYSQKKRCLIAVSEGIKDENGVLIQDDCEKDVFNHFQLGGVSRILSKWVEDELNISTRAIELSIYQRCFSPVISKVDIDEAIAIGEKAVSYALDGISDVMVSIRRLSTNPYKIDFDIVPLKKVANGIKYVPQEFINLEGNNITSSFIDYCLPLIGGNIVNPTENGLYLYANKKYF